jgi:hypothetical protein
MGGEEAIGAAGSNTRIRAVVAEGATARDSLDHIATPGPRGWIQRATTWEQYRVADLLSDASPPMASRDAVRAAAPRRMMLIAGRGEQVANRRLHRASLTSTVLWELPDSPHIGALRTHRAEWEQRVVSFLDDALLSR